jgi:hypothetical protein
VKLEHLLFESPDGTRTLLSQVHHNPVWGRLIMTANSGISLNKDSL